MICDLAISPDQPLRTEVDKLSFKLRCPHCGLIIYRTAYSTEKCPNCRKIISEKVRYLFGFQPARFRYYNNTFFTPKKKRS